MCTHNNSKDAERNLKDITCSKLSFKRKAVLFLEKLRQILPVVPRDFETRKSASCFKKSLLLLLLKLLRLTTNMRVWALYQDRNFNGKALAFFKFLLNVENRSLPHTENVKIELPSFIGRKIAIQDLCGVLISGLNQKYDNTEWLISRAIITFENECLLDINETATESTLKESREYLSSDTVEKTNYTSTHTLSSSSII